MKEDRRVADSSVPGHWISTVRLPIDHGFGGRPLWYETMVFSADEQGKVTSWLEEDCERYETREEAEAGHLAMVERWKHGKPEQGS